MRITELQLQDLSKLSFRTTALEDEDSSFFAVWLAFTGKYGYGSRGNGDGRFMSAMVHAAIEAWAPFAVILDLRELDYEFGNTIISAVTAGRDEDSQEWTTPTTVLRDREGKSQYYVLGQSPMGGGTTLRCVTSDGANCNLGPGPTPTLDEYHGAINKKSTSS